VRIEGHTFLICAECRRNAATKTCDYPTKTEGKQILEMCQKPLCWKCARKVGLQDSCKEHAG
jgi:hypothetical protein